MLLSKSEQGTIVFHIWKNLKYNLRFFLSLTLILIGFYIQYSTFNIIPGIIFVFAGNLLLLVKGYDNRVKLGTFRANAEWVTTDAAHLEKVISLNRKMKKWDLSAFDISNALGFLFFLAFMILLLIFFLNNPFSSQMPALIVVANMAILIIPHLFTGIKRITTTPSLINKIKLYQLLMHEFGNDIENDTVEYLMLLRGKDKKLPADVKMKIKFKNQPEGFLGLYAQIAINNVQGQEYPYFYVVLVAKKDSKLINIKRKNIEVPDNVIAEYNTEDDVEILVIRQHTTKKSGYHTNNKAVYLIFKAGLQAVRKVID